MIHKVNHYRVVSLRLALSLFTWVCLIAGLHISDGFAKEFSHGGKIYTVEDALAAKFPELIQLILNSEGVDYEDKNNGREYWINKLPSMTEPQIKKLYDLLETERKKLAQLEIQKKLVIRNRCGSNPTNECLNRTPPTLIKEKPVTAKDVRNAARQASQAKDWKQSVELLSRLLTLIPDDNQALLERGSAYAELGQYDKALEDILRAVELDPESSTAWSGLCWSHILAGDFVAARAACEKGHLLNPDAFAFTVNLGHTSLLQGDRAAAWAWYEKTLILIDGESDLREGPMEDFAIFLRRGWQPGLVAEAQAWFIQHGNEWLAQKAPVDKMISNAKTAMDKGDFAKAISLYEACLPIHERLYGKDSIQLANSFARLGKAYLSNNQPVRALPLLDRSLAMHESRAAYEFRYATLLALKREDEAKAVLVSWDNSLKKASWDIQRTQRTKIADIYFNLAITQEEASHHEEALLLFNDSLAIDRLLRPQMAAAAQGWIAIIQLHRQRFVEAKQAVLGGLVFAGKEFEFDINNQAIEITNPSRLYRNQDQRIATTKGCADIMGLKIPSDSYLFAGQVNFSVLENDISRYFKDKQSALSFLYCINGFSDHLVKFIKNNDEKLELADLRNMIFYDISRPDQIGLVELIFYKFNNPSLSGALEATQNNDENMRAVIGEVIERLDISPGQRMLYLSSLDFLDEESLQKFYGQLSGLVKGIEKGEIGNTPPTDYAEISDFLESTRGLAKHGTLTKF